MAGLVNGIKYTASEMRPDGSTRNSWPSGHTATAFMAATILHKEYGLTRSPWYSVGAYTLATATGVMRVLNNRHWMLLRHRHLRLCRGHKVSWQR